ncbi:single-stranded DNA-binding protein [Arthrobacter sp. MDB2-24]
MTDIITVRGYVATEVRLTVASSGLAITGFRMCSTERRFDRETGTWVDGHTNWYSVSMFRQLATNAGASIKKGDRVIVTGRLKVRPWSNADGRTGTSVEIEADTAGHDLMWGTANFIRTAANRSEAPTATDDHAAALPADAGVPDGVDTATGEVYGDGPGLGPDGEAGPEDDAGDGAGIGQDAKDRDELLEATGAPF